MKNQNFKYILFFVESPLQLLCAYEAIGYFKLKKFQIYIRLSNLSVNDNQIINICKLLFNKYEQNNIKYITIVPNLNFIAILKIILYKILIFKYIFYIDKIAIGNYQSNFFSFLIKWVDTKKVLLLDDGSGSLNVQKLLTKENAFDTFTFFRLEKKYNQNIYINHFHRIKKLVKNKIIHNEIIFIGSKISEVRIISEAEFLLLMQKIVKYFNKKIIYIPHRGESNQKINKLKKIKNIRIMTLNYPIEMIGIYNQNMYNTFVSFFSTALFTLKNIYNIEPIAIKINYNNAKNKDMIEEVYNYYSNEMKIIEL
ncbi:MAG: hypothetical protein H8E60_06155 [Candidatus Marinimicrobia bacterium]|nr:hypothetical protein [Candidatus Neomarinimicrobiota bacterium]